MFSLSDRVDNSMGEGENACYHHFLFFAILTLKAPLTTIFVSAVSVDQDQVAQNGFTAIL